MILASFGTVLLSVLIGGTSILLICLILLQKNRGAGLSGALGGVGGHSAFGTKTGDVFTWITVGLVAAFLLFNVIANWVFRPEWADRAEAAPPSVQQPLTPAPAETRPPTPATTTLPSTRAPATRPAAVTPGSPAATRATATGPSAGP